MNFNQEQSELIYQFIMSYNSDEDFKNNVQSKYDNEICKLSILDIYALEEILRYGNKKIYKEFVEARGTYTEDQAANLFDEFIELLKRDAEFKEYKTQQLASNPETLSRIEILAFRLIDMSQSKSSRLHEDIEYDPFNPILYSTDNQIKQTLENLFFGELIHEMLELPSMNSIRTRQKENGRIANIDKPYIIEKIQELLCQQEYYTQFQKVIDNRFLKIKMNILLGKGETAFEQFLKFNTNISANEILGIEKDNYEEEVYQFFQDIINKRKQDSGPRK